MAKIGTAHVEVKPVINDEALNTLGEHIEQVVTEAVRRGVEHGICTANLDRQ